MRVRPGLHRLDPRRKLTGTFHELTAEGTYTDHPITNIGRHAATEDHRQRLEGVYTRTMVVWSVWLNQGLTNRPKEGDQITVEGVRWTIKEVETKLLESHYFCLSVENK